MMDCEKAIDLLPEFVLDVLTQAERAEVLQHLEDGCPRCQLEFDQLTSAANALAETLEPVAPPAHLKQTLLQRIANVPRSHSDGVLTLPPQEHLKASPSKRAYLPYLAASIAALAAGTLVANLVSPAPQQARVTSTPRAGNLDWHQHLDAAEKAFGAPRAQLASFAHSVADEKLQVAIYHDLVAEQLHVLIAKVPTLATDRQLWLWLRDEKGAVLASGPLELLGRSRAAGVIEVVGQPRQDLHEAVITSEIAGQHDEPTGPLLGRARLAPGV